MNRDNRYELMVRGLQEVIGEQELRDVLESESPVVYWGTAPTGQIHLGYLLQLLKIADYVLAGCKVKILIADLHATLDNMKSTPELVSHRSQYYEMMINEILTMLKVDLSQIEFIRGTDYQLTPKYTMDVYKIASTVTVSDAQHASANVVKQSDNPLISGLLYPGLQALDEEYLNVSIQTGGIDQRKIFTFARKINPSLGYNKRIYLMTSMVPGLRFAPMRQNITFEQPLTREEKLESLHLDKTILLPNKYIDILFEHLVPKVHDTFSDKMSSSDNNSKLNILDSRNDTKRKINKAYCVEGDIVDNCLLDLLRSLIFPLLNYFNLDFNINRSIKYGGPISYKTISDVEQDFETKQLYPGDLKLGIIDTINSLLKPIRDRFSSKDAICLLNKAYPTK